MFKNRGEQIQRMTMKQEITNRPWAKFDANIELQRADLRNALDAKTNWHVKSHWSTLYYVSQFASPGIARTLISNDRYAALARKTSQFIEDFFIKPAVAESVEHYISVIRHVQHLDPVLFNAIWEKRSDELQGFFDLTIHAIKRKIPNNTSTQGVCVLAEALLDVRFPKGGITSGELRDATNWFNFRANIQEEVEHKLVQAHTSRAANITLNAYAVDPEWVRATLLPLFRQEHVWASMSRELEIFKQKNQILEYTELLYTIDWLSKMLDTEAGAQQQPSAVPIRRTI